MHVVTVRFRLRSGREADFMPIVLDNAARSLAQEPGCLRFDVCQTRGDPGDIFLYEIYDSAEAFADHKTMQHYLDFVEQTAPMIESKSVETFAMAGERAKS